MPGPESGVAKLITIAKEKAMPNMLASDFPWEAGLRHLTYCQCNTVAPNLCQVRTRRSNKAEPLIKKHLFRAKILGKVVTRWLRMASTEMRPCLISTLLLIRIIHMVHSLFPGNSLLVRQAANSWAAKAALQAQEAAAAEQLEFFFVPAWFAKDDWVDDGEWEWRHLSK